MNIGGLIPELCSATVAPVCLYDRPIVSSSNVDSIMMPTLLLTNVNHLLNKLDELSIKISPTEPSIDIFAITESWLDDGVPDNVCSMPSYSFFRKD